MNIIGSTPLSLTRITDIDGCHFTNNGKYIVKYGYQVERFYPDREKALPVYEPTVIALKAFC